MSHSDPHSAKEAPSERGRNWSKCDQTNTTEGVSSPVSMWPNTSCYLRSYDQGYNPKPPCKEQINLLRKRRTQFPRMWPLGRKCFRRKIPWQVLIERSSTLDWSERKLGLGRRFVTHGTGVLKRNTSHQPGTLHWTLASSRQLTCVTRGATFSPSVGSKIWRFRPSGCYLTNPGLSRGRLLVELWHRIRFVGQLLP